VRRAAARRTVYELHVATFTPDGTLDAVAGRLDHLIWLGVDAVHLMPLGWRPAARAGATTRRCRTRSGRSTANERCRASDDRRDRHVHVPGTPRQADFALSSALQV
jgi:hypothetical protein